METATKHVHQGSVKEKVIRLKDGTRFHQHYRICEGCTGQFEVRLTELKKGNHRGQAN